MLPTVRQFTDQAKLLVRRISGASRAQSEAAHTAKHLQHVEQWAHERFSKLAEEQTRSRVQAEERLRRIEKMQAALLNAASGELPDPALQVFDIPKRYFEKWNSVLEALPRDIAAIGPGRSVVEFCCGFGKGAAFCQAQGAHYTGMEPSPIVRAVAERQWAGQCAIKPLQSVAAPAASFDVALFLAEKPRWALVEVEKVFAFAAGLLRSHGELIFASPISFDELQQIDWRVSEKLAQAGFHAEPWIGTAAGYHIAIVQRG